MARALKPGGPPAEPEGMARDKSCPVCDADLLFAGDERSGDTVVCTYCGAPFTVSGKGGDDADWDLEEDY